MYFRNMKTLYTLPVPSTSLTSEAKFKEKLGRACTLTCEYEDESESEIMVLAMFFEGTEAYKATYYCARDIETLRAYDKVVDFGETDWLKKIRKNLKRDSSANVTNLSHLVVNFDDGPAYEFICREFRTEIYPKVKG